MSTPADSIVETVKLSKPAQRALAAAGIVTFADLRTWSRADVAALHGIGPTAFRGLEPAMRARGVAFKP